MDMLALIGKKRAGGELTAGEIGGMVQGVVRGEVPDYQLAAWLMAVCYEHLTYAETLALTRACVESGVVLDWADLPGPVVDKHSTGGVGDKVSLALVPWLAAAGLIVPKISGRGLGYTGGTIDKLESIPGFRIDLKPEELRAQVRRVGCAVVAQSEGLVPADKHIYALRDATDTVAEVGLIAASVMSKKIAAGARHIVLDVKCGEGAFFTTLEDARQFGGLACRIGADFDRRVGYVISAMDQPLGRAVGNALEVREAMAALGDAAVVPDLHALCVELGAVLLHSAGVAQSLAAGREVMQLVHVSGQARQRFEEWIAAQGGNLAAFQVSLDRLSSYRRIVVLAGEPGYIASVDGRGLGELARSLGAGRLQADDAVDPLVGIECAVKKGDRVALGDPLAVAYAKRLEPQSDQEISAVLKSCFTVARDRPESIPVVMETYTAESRG